MTDDEIIAKAVQWAEENNDILLGEIVLGRNPRKEKECIFMAGSAGAGKTETIRNMELKKNFIVIDADEFRVSNKYYEKTDGERKGNAHLIQRAANIGLKYCRNHCIENEIAFVQDATFSNDGDLKLMKKLSGRGWDITILYIYQNPRSAWHFTEIRERKEGRNITKENFVRSFVNSIKNIEKVQEKYPGIRILITIKDSSKIVAHAELSDIRLTSMLVKNNIDVPNEHDILKLLQ